MADDKNASQQQTVKAEEPKFMPNGNGNHAAGDEHGQTKYAPQKSSADDHGEGDEGDSAKPRANPRRTLTLGLIALVVVIAALMWGIRYYHYSTTHVGTDDAYVTGNLVQVSPIISGTLSQLTVEEGDQVKQGQLIARLEDSGPQAAVRQAKAAYDAAETLVPQARISLQYQQQATDAAIRKAQAEIGAQNAKTAGAQQQVVLSAATVQNQVRQAQSQVAQAQAQAAGADAQVKTALAAVQAQRQSVQTAQSAAAAAAATIAAAQANATKATRDETRYAVLVKQEAVTQQQDRCRRRRRRRRTIPAAVDQGTGRPGSFSGGDRAGQRAAGTCPAACSAETGRCGQAASGCRARRSEPRASQPELRSVSSRRTLRIISSRAGRLRRISRMRWPGVSRSRSSSVRSRRTRRRRPKPRLRWRLEND